MYGDKHCFRKRVAPISAALVLMMGLLLLRRLPPHDADEYRQWVDFGHNVRRDFTFVGVDFHLMRSVVSNGALVCPQPLAVKQQLMAK